MATAAASSKKTTKAAEEAAAKEAEEQAAAQEGSDGNVADKEAEAEATKARAETEEALEILESKIEPKRWVIGKPPEEGGTEDEFSIYVQRPLGYMARMRFFALVSTTVADAIKSGGSINFGGSDIFGSTGSIRQRAAQLSTEDFADAASFMALAMQLVSYAPDFLLDCYVLWLDVPPAEKAWAKIVFEQDKDPSRNKWGLSEDDGLEMIEVFIDQNYDDIRDFFGVKLPRLVQRVRERDQARQARESESAQSKQ